MNKAKKTGKNKRFADLAILGETLFHAGDLANLWGIGDRNTLYKTLSRYVADGLLHRIHKGFYSLKDVRSVDPYALGAKVLHSPAYITCESVLFDAGWINQKPQEISLVSGLSKRYQVAGRRYRSRKLDDRFLHGAAGIETRDGYRIASAPRALADLLYFNPRTYIDAARSELVDWRDVRAIAKAVGYNIPIPL